MALKTRVNNASTLNLASAWSPATVPTTTDQLYWNGVTGTNATVAMGGNINVGGTGGGIRLDSSQTVAVTVNNATAAALTLGTLGIDLSTSGANLTIGGTAATLVLNANQTWQEKAGLSTLIYSAISGAFSINFASGGFWYLLSSGNSYSGGTTVGGAVVRISSNTAFGTGAITLNSGAQASSTSATGYTLANALTLNGTITLGDAVGTGLLTFSGTTTIAGTTTLTTASTVTLSGQLTGTGTLTKSGAGDLFLTGTTNNNSGAVTISQGNIWLASDNSGTPNQLASVSSITINSPGQIFYNGATSPATITSTISGGGTLVVSTTNGVTFSGNLSGYTQQLYLYSTNTTGTTTKFTASAAQAIPTAGVTFQSFLRNTGALTQTFEYTGAANVSSTGVLRLNPGANGHNYVVSNANTGGYTLSISGAVTALTSASQNFVVDVGASAGLLTLSGNITQSSTGVIAVSKTGSGPATISGANTFTSTVSVSAGTLNANSATALGADASSGTVSSGATLSLGAALNYSTRNFTINGTGVGSGGALVHAFAGTAKIGAITLGAASYVRGTATGDLSSAFALAANRLTAGAASGVSFTLSGTITSTFPAGLTVGGQASDTGTVIVSGTNTLPGALFVNYGTLLTQSAQALGVTGSALNATVAANATLSIGVLATYTGALTLNGSVVVAHSGSTNLGTITSNANTAYVRGTVLNAALASPFSVISDLTFGAAASASLALTGVINSSASNVLVNIGQQAADTGTVFFNANNTYAGTTTLAYGTAQVVTNQNGSVSGPLGKSGTIRFTGGTLQYSVTNQFDYSPRLDTAGSQQWKIDTNGQTVTFATVLQGASSSLTKSGTGTLLVTGTNTYTGNTSTGAGTLQAGNTQAFGTTGTVTLTASGATLQTLTTGGQNGKLTVAALTNSAGGTIKIGG